MRNIPEIRFDTKVKLRCTACRITFVPTPKNIEFCAQCATGARLCDAIREYQAMTQEPRR